jgi:hypothetical protein
MLIEFEELLKSLSIITAATILAIALTVAGADFVNSAQAAQPPDPCIVSQLHATAQLQGAAGTREGAIILKNVSSRACRLKGRAAVALRDSRGAALVVHTQLTGPILIGPSGLTPQQRAAGVLHPGSRAFIAIRWTNWCGRRMSLPIRAVVHLPGRKHSLSAALESINTTNIPAVPPPCNGPTLPSTLAVGPLELVSRSAQVP